jgi:hypothetical protein
MRRIDDDSIDYDEDERRAFAELPREAPLTDGEVERMTRRLRAEGFFRPRGLAWRRTLLAAAALLLFALGAVAGGVYTRRNSLEEQLARTDLSVSERILVLQRAGTAYVRAAQGYADATARVDSTAVEVASRVLVGAAHAVARNKLDGGMAARLSEVLQPSATVPVATTRKPVIWF